MINKIIYGLIFISIIYTGPKTKSLILPGWGESSLGMQSRSKKLITSDIILWLVAINGKNISKNYQNDYKAFSAEHAGVNWIYADYLYAIDIGYYNDLNSYNNERLRQRSLEIETDQNGKLIRESGHSLYPTNGNFNFNWDSTSNRKAYKDMRISYANWNKYSNFAIAGLIVNRIISIVDVLYLEKKAVNLPLDSKVIYKGKKDLSFYLTLNF